MYNVYIMPESAVLTLRLDAKLKKQLDRISKSMNRSRSFVAAQAIQEYVSVNEWQISEIKKGLAEADAGDFATEEEVQQTIRKLDASCALNGCERRAIIWIAVAEYIARDNPDAAARNRGGDRKSAVEDSGTFSSARSARPDIRYSRVSGLGNAVHSSLSRAWRCCGVDSCLPCRPQMAQPVLKRVG
jgi:RHH-type rel operon transcriptional repressor/antitoxin RelB